MKHTTRSDAVCNGDSRDKNDKGAEVREVELASEGNEIDIRHRGEEKMRKRM